MKKIFKKRKIRVIETIDNNNLGSLARTLLGSFVVIFIFYSLTIINKFH